MRPRERRFIAELLRCGDPAEAAVKAGYAPGKARDEARRLLAKPVVRFAAERAWRDQEKRTGVTKERVLAELARIAFADLGRVADWDGEILTLKPLAQLSDAEAAAIAGLTFFRVKRKQSVTIRLHAKAFALKALARYFGLEDGSGGVKRLTGHERLMQRLEHYLRELPAPAEK
jgi:phage terminase small subunit